MSIRRMNSGVEHAPAAGAHRSSWNCQLAERAESIHRKATKGASSHTDRASAGSTDDITLALHGDLNPTAVPYLQGVLEALLLLRPGRLTFDFSEVRHVSLDSLCMLEHSGDEVGAWSLLDPSPSACADLINLGRSDLVDP
jgi:hypothetical protein